MKKKKMYSEEEEKKIQEAYEAFKEEIRKIQEKNVKLDKKIKKAEIRLQELKIQKFLNDIDIDYRTREYMIGKPEKILYVMKSDY